MSTNKHNRTATIQVKVTIKLYEQVVAAAERAEQKLTDWVREKLTRAATEGERPCR